MADLKALYQQVILEHYRAPRNFGRPLVFTTHARGDNPMCGDNVEVFLHLEHGVIQGAAFEGEGCAIARASASLMTQALRGMTVEKAREFQKRFGKMIQSEPGSPCPQELQGVEALAGVRAYPTRHKCALLCWRALEAALDGDSDPVTTELS